MTRIPDRGFPVAEFQDRTTRAQAMMAAQGLDGLLLMTEPEVRYFSGFQTLFWQSPTRPWFLLVPASGKPIAVIPEIGAELMRMTWIEDIRTWAAPNPIDDGVSLLIEALADLGSLIGILKGPETLLRMPLADFERLNDALPRTRFLDAAQILRQMRIVKSAAEIEKLAHICAIGSATFDKVPEIARPNLPEADVFRAFRREALAQGADDAPYVVGGADQGGYRDIISPPTDRPLQRRDILMLDTGCVWDGYFCDFDRNFAIGDANDASRRAYDVLWRATEAGIEAARPGATCRDLFHAMRAVIQEMDQGSGDVGRLGHGLGMQLTEYPSHAAWDDTVLRENMVLTLEPSLSYGDGQMMVHEEDVVVQDGAPRLLTTRAAPDLPVI
ncbi:MAG: Xaa-Pro peptidase family protein [Pseudomonadota bacterium]